MARVLIVDNQKFNRDLVVTILGRAGHEVVTASSGEQAIRAAIRKQPDLILMDMQLPDLDGFETTRRILADPKSADSKVVAFTALVLPEDRRRATDAGCLGYLTKPVGARELITAVKEFLRT